MKSNDKYSWLYDFSYMLSTTINCQLMLSMLAESLFDIPDIQFIQINTDGLTVKIRKEYEELYYQKCKEWEQLTRFELEYAHYSKMIIRDVNFGVLISLIDGNNLRASYTHNNSNDCCIVKEMRIGQSAAKHPNGMKVQRLSRKGVHLNSGKARQVYV